MLRKGIFLPFSIFAVFPCVLLLVCCGGHEKVEAPAGRECALEFTVRWPERTRLIPSASQSIRVSLFYNDRLLREQLIARPPAGQDTTTAVFNGLPPVSIRVVATAYPSSDGTGVPQATGSLNVELQPGRVERISLNMVSTIERLEISPPNPSLNVGQILQLTVTAKDAEGNIVLTAPSKIVWSSADAGVATVSTEGVVTGLAAGITSISVVETESGKAATVTIVVNPAQGQGGRIIGRVTDPDGSPLAGVRVETSDGANIWRVSTNAGGEYALENVPVGQRVVTFSGTGRTTSFEVTVAQGGEVVLNAVLYEFDGVITSPPVITLNPTTVDQARGQALVSGSVTQLDSDKAVLIVNGSEMLIPVGADGSFSATAILRNGENIIYIRATNGLGTTLSEEIRINYSPPSEEFYFRVTLTWDGSGDVDLHTWDPNGGHSFYGNMSIGTGELDVDNVTAYGPENFTCRRLVPGRYRIGVNAYARAGGRRAVITVTINHGVNAGRSYSYGPYTFSSSNGNSGYPVTGDTDSWWRPVDVLVGQDGNISVSGPDGSALYRGRSTQLGTHKR